MPVRIKLSGNWKAFKEEMQAYADIPGATIGTGVPDIPASGERARKAGLSLLDLSEINEFGDAQAGIPARPIFTPAMDQNEAKYARKFDLAVRKALRKGGSKQLLRRELAELAQEMVDDVHKVQKAQKFEPLSDVTVARKGHDIAWLETGELLENIEAVVETERRFTAHRGDRGGRFRDELGRFVKSPGSSS